MPERQGLSRLNGWPLIVIFGLGFVSFVGFIRAAVVMKSRRWTVAAVVTTALTVFGWILMGTWQHDGEASNGAVAYVVELWIALVAFVWVVSADFQPPPPPPLTLPLPPGARVAGAPPPPPSGRSGSVPSAPRPAQWPQWTPPTTPMRDAPAAGPRRRTPPACPVPPGLDITSYTPRQLDAVLDWIASDGVARTREQLLTEFVHALGYARRGNRIVAAFDAAYRKR